MIRSERGATALLIAAAMLLLIGVAAVAVDISDAKDERRSNQHSVDAAALGGGVELIVSGGLQEAIDNVKSLSNTNLGRTIPEAAWTACVDADALAFPSNSIPGIVGGTPCISFGPNNSGIAFTRLRVRLPNQETPTAFGRILGFDEVLTSAAAVVGLDGVGHFGSFPASVFNGAGGGDQFCIKAGTGTAGVDTCGNATTGDFGNFQPYFYTNVNPSNPPTTCTSGNQPNPLAYAMSNGIDHFLGTTPTAPGNRRNGGQCPQFPGPAFPNRVDSGSGYSNNDITDGLVAGGTWANGFDGRLTKKIWGSPYGTFTIFNEEIDNRPLWSYINPSVVTEAGVPTACQDAASGPAQNNGGAEAAFTQAQSNMVACLQHPNVPSDLFTDELYESPRLTIVPMFHQAVPLGNNACCYDIKDFVPVFIESIWTARGPQWQCTGGVIDDTNEDFCRHDPGRVGTIHINAAGQQRINSVSATVLSCDVLGPPGGGEEKCRRVGSGANQVTIFANLFLER